MLFHYFNSNPLICDIITESFLLLQAENFWLFGLLGRFHPLMVHFPVSLLLLAWILSLFKQQTQIVKLITTIGATTAIISAAFGLLLAWQEGMAGDLLDYHRYSGLFLGAISIGLLYLIYNQKWETGIFKGLLTLAALGTTVSGHLGASLTHGEDYLTEVLPWNQSAPVATNLSSYNDILSPAEEVKLVSNVRAVFAHNCYKCHGEVKQKGDLRLDEKEFIFTGGENGKVIVAGNAAQSELYRRITLPVNDEESMPSKGKSLKGEEIELIKFWIDKGALWPDNLEQVNVFPMADLAPRNPTLPSGSFENPIDLLVGDYFEKNDLNWKAKVSDKVFLRRVYLDVIGLLPSFEQFQSFEKDTNPNKRKAIVDELLTQNEAYAQHWLTFWNDALRNDYTGTGYITKGRFNINDWLYKSLKENKAYDVFVKELLNPTDASKGFIEGIKWRGTVNASQRTEMQAAQNVGQVLLGLNLKCASCHDSFVSNWKLADAYAFANIFSEETLEIARCEKPTGQMAPTSLLWPSLGTIDSTASRDQKLAQLANYMVQPANGRLYRTLVNRIWAQLMGRGIVAAVDEMDNQPWSADLLDWMAVNFVDNNYDIKKLLFLILTSDAYQMESEVVNDPTLLAKDSYQFKGMVTRRMTAEQFSDAVSKVIKPIYCQTDIAYKTLKEAGYEPTDTHFVRASLVANNPFLTALGRPNREIVTTARPSQASLLQALELTNGTTLDSTLHDGANKWLTTFKETKALVTTIYQEALCRNPTDKELELSLKALGKTPSVEQVQDLFWSIVILPEFQLIN